MTNFSFLKFLKKDIKRYNQLFGYNERRIISLLSPRFLPVLILRIANLFRKLRLNPIAKIFSSLNLFIFGIEISNETFIDHGIFFPHTSGTVIGAKSIGKNCIIFQGVTLGAKFLDSKNSLDKRPIVEDDVQIGAGAKVLGGITVSSNSKINANALIVVDI